MMDRIDLSEVLSEFARTMVTDFPIQSILDHLVERIVEVLPISGAGVTLISEGNEPRYVAAFGPSALSFEKLQTELGEGPCLEAYRTDEAVAVPDLGNDERFPEFAKRALGEGLAAVFTFPLRHGEDGLGALDLYRKTPGALDAAAMGAAQTLADVTAAYLLNARARSDLLEASARTVEYSRLDPLTGLPNRVHFLERLDHAMARVQRSQKMTAVLFADLDNFKEVNDQYGHSAGDEVLVTVARRLSGALRPGDTLARMSGDEFVILCEGLTDVSEVHAIADRIGAKVGVPIVLSAAEVVVSMSVGISFAQHSNYIPEQILDNADVAMYEAKRNGGARHEIFSNAEPRRSGRRADLTYDLDGALSRGELRLAYQPIVGVNDGRLVGVEALLRWDHPDRGRIPPAMFIPLAERSGLINDIGQWALEQACRDKVRWDKRSDAGLVEMHVNVSVHQLMAREFATTVAETLSHTLTDPSTVTLEVTETVFIHDGNRAQMVLADLKDLGVSIALDDFGTGYSSLSHLGRFPIDELKIDRCFVAELAKHKVSHAIVSAVIDLAHTLGMTAVAEGVENAEQRRNLAELGCDSCQGYLFARPMSADAFDVLPQDFAMPPRAELSRVR